jgi:tripartite-type tricarboxylate transporter receptor subunit TctC
MRVTQRIGTMCSARRPVPAILLVALALPAPALQAAWPEKPVRVIVPSAPGGGTDASIRILAPRLSELLGQPVLIDNRAGASGNIGAEVVARAAPDGYTLLAAIASHTSNPAMMKVSYDVLRDFAPVSMTVTVPSVLISTPSLPARTTKELIALARARPGELQFASPGGGSNQHLAMELFLVTAKAQMLHVPYKGLGPALTDVIGGHVPLMMSNVLIALPHIRAGRVRAFGVTSLKRIASAPEIPTLAEGGATGFEAVQWFGVFAPAGTAVEIVNTLHAGLVKVLQDPAVRERFQRDGAEPTPSTSPEAFTALVRSEVARWHKLVATVGLKSQ